MKRQPTPDEMVAALSQTLPVLGDGRHFDPELRRRPIGQWPLTTDDIVGLVRILDRAGYVIELSERQR